MADITPHPYTPKQHSRPDTSDTPPWSGCGFQDCGRNWNDPIHVTGPIATTRALDRAAGEAE